MSLPKLPDRLKDPYRMPPFEVGDKVWDDLTHSVCEIKEIIDWGYVLDNNWLDGYRYAWEVSLPFNVWDES